MNETGIDLNIKVIDIKDLFIAPSQDPLSNYEYVQCGEPAILRTIRYIKANGYKNITNLLISLPKNVASNINDSEVRDMIHYYIQFQLKENNENLMIFWRNTNRILCNAIIFLIFCMAIVAIVGVETFMPNLPSLLRSVLVEGFTVIGWVIMWRPIELILNEWTLLKIKNKIFRQLLKTNVKILSNDC
jgi:hypothetical protein